MSFSLSRIELGIGEFPARNFPVTRILHVELRLMGQAAFIEGCEGKINDSGRSS